MKAKSLMIAMLSLSLIASGCADKNDTTSKAESDSGQQAKQEQGVTISDIIKNKKDFVAYQAGDERVFHIWIFENGKMFMYTVDQGDYIYREQVDGKSIDDVKKVIAEHMESPTTIQNGMAVVNDETLWLDPQIRVNDEGFALPTARNQLISSGIEGRSETSEQTLTRQYGDLPGLKVVASKADPKFARVVFTNILNSERLDTPVYFGNIDNSNEKYIELSQVAGLNSDANPNIRIFITKTKDIPGLKSEDYKKLDDDKTFAYHKQKSEDE